MIMKYSKEQLAAVTHVDGPMLVLAGPGSGKTAVITGRTRYLTEKAGIDPGSILVITFTKAAALEMKQRYVRMTGSNPGIRFSTFHSVFFTVIRLAYGINPSQIISEDTARRYIREKASSMELSEADDRDFAKNILSEISLVKSSDINIENYYSLHVPAEAFREIFNSYGNYMKKQRLIDFDDMMLLCVRLFKEREDILHAWQEKYRYILIDEFQDADRLQYNLIRQIAEPENNLFVVGDDDQSIYRFRGSDPSIMLNFPKDYKNCEKVVLSANYRSTGKIVDFAGRIISKNKRRFKKNISAPGRAGEEPKVLKFRERKDEDTFLVKDIIASHTKGLKYSDMAVIYRTNLAARPFAEKLMQYNIPFVMRESAPNIYDHWIAKDILAYLHAAAGDRSRGRIITIMNRPVRYLSRESIDSASVDLPGKPHTVSFIRWKDFYKGKSYMALRVEEFAGDLRALSKLAPFAAIHYLRNVIGYDAFLRTYAGEHGIEAEELMEIIEELSESAKPYASLSEWEEHIKKVTEELKKTYSMQRRDEGTKDAVSVLTMHGCKGLEFDRVYIPCAVDGMIPYKKAVKEADIEEERRLFYVACTRAKNTLIITVPGKLYGREKDPTPFLQTGRDTIKEINIGTGHENA